MDEFSSFKIFHGGTFDDSFSNRLYVGGNTITIKIEVDKLSLFEIVDYVMETGSYSSKDFVIYCFNPDEQLFKELLSDQDVLYMAKSKHYLELYIQPGPISKPNLVNEALPNVSSPNPNVPLPNVSSGYEIVGGGNSGSESEEYESGYSGSGSDNEEDTSENQICPSDNDDDDDELTQSIAAIQKRRKEDAESKKNLLEQCLKGDVEHDGCLIEKVVEGGSPLEG